MVAASGDAPEGSAGSTDHHALSPTSSDHDDEIPVHLEKNAQYYEKMREDQEARRSRREDGEGGPRSGEPAREPKAEATAGKADEDG